MKITFAKSLFPETGVVVVGVLQDRKLSPSAKILDKKMKGGLLRAIKASRFKGRKDQSLTMLSPAETRLDRVYVVGLGKIKDLKDTRLQALGGQIYAALGGRGFSSASVMIDALANCPLDTAEMAANIGYGARLRSYRFDKYRTKEKATEKPSLKTLTFRSDAALKARRIFAKLNRIADGVFLTRDLVSEPANILYPETLAKHAKELTKLGVKVEILSERQMSKLGMGALLGVGQGSARESKMAIMQWQGAPGGKSQGGKKKAANAPIAFVGKGVTFDSGGISLKPSGGMEDMKWDMAGAGVVIGLMKALAGRKAKVNVVAVVGMVENMPSGQAQRPGDIVTSMSGQTIHVMNTDAEGRLVLADALWYCQDRFKPRFMVNLATLTGAIIISLGNEKAGLFSNNDQLAERLAAAGEKVGENLWRMPLGDAYDKMIKSDIADVQNISGGRGAGSITAAQFLQRFVAKTPWAHLDIAGVTWSSKTQATVPKGGTAFGVRLLDRLVSEYYEEK
jgi:leucyl aminopeptidase